jgi:hypothetical protein
MTWSRLEGLLLHWAVSRKPPPAEKVGAWVRGDSPQPTALGQCLRVASRALLLLLTPPVPRLCPVACPRWPVGAAAPRLEDAA